MMMDANVSRTRVPPGFRFHPTDEELVGYYLRKKIASQKIDFDVIREFELNRIEPWDLQDRCRIGYEEQKEWYFFSRKYKKYPTGTRTNRATMAGFWKATGRDKPVYGKSDLIGIRKTLVFYRGRAPNVQKTNWVMHEYRLESQNNDPSQEVGWVLCRAFKKRISGRAKSNEDDGCNKFLCNQKPVDTNIHHLSSVQSQDDKFADLPLLQSPSNLPPLKSPSSQTMLQESDKLHDSSKEEDDHEISISNNTVNDWSALDKFAASQLSHDDLSFEYRNMSDMALLAAIAEW